MVLDDSKDRDMDGDCCDCGVSFVSRDAKGISSTPAASEEEAGAEMEIGDGEEYVWPTRDIFR